MSRLDDLARHADAVLNEGMRPQLKAAIDALLAAGHPPAEILAFVRRKLVAMGRPANSLPALAAEAYLESLERRPT